MCTVSMIGDEFSRHWEPYKQLPQQQPFNQQPDWEKLLRPPVSPEEFNKLKAEVELMKQLLKAAKIYDEKNNEPHCEMDEKIALLKAMAKMMGVDLSDVFPETLKTNE